MSIKSLNPIFSASLTSGSPRSVNCVMLRDRAASRCGFSPVAMIFVSFSGSMPKRRSARRKVISDVVPNRFTPPVFPLSCSKVVMSASETMWSMNSGKFVETMIVSAPASREVTSVAEGAMMRSNSPVSNAWITMVLALMAMTSALRPFFLKKPF